MALKVLLLLLLRIAQMLLLRLRRKNWVLPILLPILLLALLQSLFLEPLLLLLLFQLGNLVNFSYKDPVDLELLVVSVITLVQEREREQEWE